MGLLAAILAVAAIGFLGWVHVQQRRILSALAALQQREQPVLPGLLPMTPEQVDLQIDARLAASSESSNAERAVLAVLLEQASVEFLAKTPYDKGQRRMAVEQRLLKHFAKQGLQVPLRAKESLKQGGWL